MEGASAKDSQELKETFLAYLAVVGLLAVLARLTFIGFIKENLGGLAVIPFVYLPVVLIRRKGRDVSDYGLSSRGLLKNLALGLAACTVVFPPFWAGYHLYGVWLCKTSPTFQLPPDPGMRLIGNLLVVALPEEFFFRGFMQTHTDRAWPGGVRILGANLGRSALVISALFALLHLATDLRPFRLGVFFPSLLFCWLRARTGSIVPGIVLHGLSNVFMNTLEASYGIVGLCLPI